eukprot:TRINITY_DN65388_c0_g1_i1.p1 TRINITY_DN65388_c0_g1~~TRINITY_DN65388_c0_g1_i1.p1  ORF type:complete len:582 (+),score=172.73 TRINITY_DN65388_c0_g1_i1:92-1747(+)
MPDGGDTAVSGRSGASTGEAMYQWWWEYFGGYSPAVPAPAWRNSQRLSVRSRASLARTGHSTVAQGESMKLISADAGAKGGDFALPEAGLERSTEEDEAELIGGLPPAAASVGSSIANLCNVCLGAGTLSMPFAFKQVGIVGGLTVLTVIYLCMVVSAMMLTDVARTMNIRSIGCTYGALISTIWGEKGTRATNIIVVVATFGISIAYFQLAGDLLAPPIGYWLGDTPKDYCNFFARREGPIIVALALQYCLCTAPTLHMLRYVSLVAVVSMLYMTSIIVIRSGERWYEKPKDGDEFVTFELTSGVFRAVSICTFAFAPHIQMVQLFSELKNPSRPRTFAWIFTSFTLCWLVYGMVGAFGYYTFYGETDGNIILNHNADDTAITVGRIGVAISVMAGFPMMMNPCVAALDALVFPAREPSIWGRRLGWLLIVIACSFGLAMIVEDVSLILGITGAGALTCASFIIPSVAYVTVFHKHHGGNCGSTLLKVAWLVLLLGVCFGGISLVMAVIDDIINADGKTPCTWPENCPAQRCCPGGQTYGLNVTNQSMCP